MKKLIILFLFISSALFGQVNLRYINVNDSLEIREQGTSLQFFQFDATNGITFPDGSTQLSAGAAGRVLTAERAYIDTVSANNNPSILFISPIVGGNITASDTLKTTQITSESSLTIQGENSQLTGFVDLGIFAGDDINMYAVDELEIDADNIVRVLSGASTYLFNDDTLFADGTGTSTANTAKFKNFIASENITAEKATSDTIVINATDSGSDSTAIHMTNSSGLLINSTSDIIITNTNDRTAINSQSIDINATSEILGIEIINGAKEYKIEGDTLFLDGTNGSTENNIKAKTINILDSLFVNNGWITGVDLSGNLSGDTITTNVLIVGGSAPVDTVYDSQYVIENTLTDKINTDTLLMVNDTISGHDLLLAVRKILYPNDYVSYLPNDSLYTTPSITLNIPTKVLIPTAEKYSRNWAFFDKGGSDFALQFQGSDSSRFNIAATTSILTSASNVVFELFMYKNGVLEEGVASERKVGTGADVGSISLTGAFDMAENDYIEVFVLIDVSSTVTFTKTSIVIKEDGLID